MNDLKYHLFLELFPNIKTFTVCDPNIEDGFDKRDSFK